MGIYYCAIDLNSKLLIEPPNDFSIKYPGVCHPNSPFPGMVIMKNCQGFNFEIYNDMSATYDDYIGACEDITDQVYSDYLELFPWAKDEIYEKKDV